MSFLILKPKKPHIVSYLREDSDQRLDIDILVEDSLVHLLVDILDLDVLDVGVRSSILLIIIPNPWIVISSAANKTLVTNIHAMGDHC